MDQPNLYLPRVWESLRAGVEPGKSPFSMLYLATTGRDGAPKLRTIVIRRFDESRGTIGFNTDIRSPKAAEIYLSNRVSILGYDMDGGVQVRMEGDAVLHRFGPENVEAWVASEDRSRICYRHAFAPGTELEDPALGDPTDAMIAPADRELGLENFAAVSIRLTKLELLDLKAKGHRRVLFNRDEAGGWQGTWIAP